MSTHRDNLKNGRVTQGADLQVVTGLEDLYLLHGAPAPLESISTNCSLDKHIIYSESQTSCIIIAVTEDGKPNNGADVIGNPLSLDP